MIAEPKSFCSQCGRVIGDAGWCDRFCGYSDTEKYNRRPGGSDASLHDLILLADTQSTDLWKASLLHATPPSRRPRSQYTGTAYDYTDSRIDQMIGALERTTAEIRKAFDREFKGK